MELDRQKVKKKLLPFDDSRWWWFRKNCRLWASPWILWGLFQYITPKQKKNYRTVFPGFKNDDVFPLSHFQLSNVWGTLGIAIPSGNLNIAVENGHLQWLFHEKCWIFPVRYFDITRGLIHHTFHEKPSFSHGFPMVLLRRLPSQRLSVSQRRRRQVTRKLQCRVISPSLPSWTHHQEMGKSSWSTTSKKMGWSTQYFWLVYG